MRARGYGRIVNISSTTGTRGSNPGEAAYSAAKAGMLGLSMGLALEVAKQGITVNSVAPGWIATGSQYRRRAAMRPQYTPLGRAGRPEEVAGGGGLPGLAERPATSPARYSSWMAATA